MNTPKTAQGNRRKSATDYNCRVTFLGSGNVDNLGNIAAATVVCTCWANVKAVISVRGAAMLKADSILQKTNYEICIRWRDDIDESMLVEIKGKQFTLDNLADPDGQGIELRMIVSEVDENI